MRRHVGHLLVVALATWGCDQDSEDVDASLPKWQDVPAPAPSGPTFEDEDFVLTVQSPKPCNKTGPMAPRAGERRISVPVEVKSRSPRQVPVGAMSFTLEDAEGHEYRPTLAGCSPAIAQTALSDGKSIQGHVAFDVPDDVGRFELRFEPFLIGRKKIDARVRVPR